MKLIILLNILNKNIKAENNVFSINTLFSIYLKKINYIKFSFPNIYFASDIALSVNDDKFIIAKLNFALEQTT